MISGKTLLLTLVGSLIVQMSFGVLCFAPVGDLVENNPLDLPRAFPHESAIALHTCISNEYGRPGGAPDAKALIQTCRDDRHPTVKAWTDQALTNGYGFGLHTSRYCTGPVVSDTSAPLCLGDGRGGYEVNWSLVAREMLPWWRWFIMALVAVGGSYCISNSWANETKLGTLAFIRLSPEPRSRLLLGKLLGTPVLVYLMALTLVPLHLGLSSLAPLPWGFELASDGFAIALAGTVLVASLTASIWTGTPSIALLALVIPLLALGSTLMGTSDVAAYGDPNTGPAAHWYGLSLFEEPTLALVLGTVVLLALAQMLWRSAIRRFDDPQSTPLTRWQTYGLAIALNGLAMGFFVPVGPLSSVSGVTNLQSWGAVAAGWTLYQLFAVWALFPDRQRLLDWCRYRHLDRTAAKVQGRRPVFQRRAIGLGQWIWHEDSPPLAVPAILTGLTILLWSPWAIAVTWEITTELWPNGYSPQLSVQDPWLCLGGLLIPTALITALLALCTWQFLTLHPKSRPWMVGTVCGVTLLPIGVLVTVLALVNGPDNMPLWPWLLTFVGPTLLPHVALSLHSVLEFAKALAIAIIPLALCLRVTTRTLRHLGRSESQALLGDGKG
ncbi:MAG: hypothetical protein Fur0042_10940 [Cyanophyceae cyanobacterium]